MKNYIVFTRWNGGMNQYLTGIKPYHTFEYCDESMALRLTQLQAIKLVRSLNKECSRTSATIYGYAII